MRHSGDGRSEKDVEGGSAPVRAHPSARFESHEGREHLRIEQLGGDGGVANQGFFHRRRGGGSEEKLYDGGSINYDRHLGPCRALLPYQLGGGAARLDWIQLPKRLQPLHP